MLSCFRIRLDIFDLASDKSYHTLSLTDVNTADSQVYTTTGHANSRIGIGTETSTRDYSTKKQ